MFAGNDLDGGERAGRNHTETDIPKQKLGKDYGHSKFFHISFGGFENEPKLWAGGCFWIATIDRMEESSYCCRFGWFRYAFTALFAFLTILSRF